MITEYTDVTEFKRLIEEKKIKPERVKWYLRQKGIIFTASNAATLAQQVYTLFLGCKEMSEITDMYQSDANYEKSLMLKAKINTPLNTEEDILDFFVDEINRFRNTQSIINSANYEIEQPVRDVNSEQISVRFAYEKRLPGKNRLLQTKKRTMQFHIRKINDDQVAIDVRQQSASDTSEALRFLDKIVGTTEESAFSLMHINLLSFPTKSNVAFFDSIMNHDFADWRLKTITGITLKKTDSEEDDDETEISDDSATQEGTLAGINQAALQGQGLWHNEFVKNTLTQGYVISSMRFRYTCTKGAEEFAVLISCKGEDLRIDIDKTYCEEDGRIYIQPFSKARQNEIILEFQTAANDINTELRNELATKTNDAQIS
ncbi:hypothetical protein FACS189492_0410 [Clostridia bacterium]|nr:hypothetical protein FACS189492_0410 [Clostridia bacterium]